MTFSEMTTETHIKAFPEKLPVKPIMKVLISNPCLAIC